MACDQIVMAPGGRGWADRDRLRCPATRSRLAVPRVRDPLAPRKMRSWSLWAAMIDPQIEVFRCTRLGDVEYFCEQERADAQSKPEADGKGPPWQEGECVTTPSIPFHAGGTQAVELPPGQPHRRQFRPVQTTLQPGRRSDLGRAGLGRHADRFPPRAEHVGVALGHRRGGPLPGVAHPRNRAWAALSAPSASCCSSGAITCPARPSGWKSRCFWPALPAC